MEVKQRRSDEILDLLDDEVSDKDKRVTTLEKAKTHRML